MIHSYLITGGTVEKRSRSAYELIKKQGVAESSVDVITVKVEEEKKSIGIEQIRDFEHRLSLKPYQSPIKIGAIVEANEMTTEAQNSLLKTLEEPPAHSIIILTAPAEKTLLPTVVSRCQIIKLKDQIEVDVKSEEFVKTANDFTKLLEMGRGPRLAWAEKNKTLLNTQPAADKLIDVWITVLRDLMLLSGNPKAKTLTETTNLTKGLKISNTDLNRSLEEALKTKGLINQYISPRLVVEAFLLELPIF